MVQRLRVETVADPTPDPYGQPGFSTLTAYVDEANDALDQQLRRAADEGISVIVRCATLEIEGRVVTDMAKRTVSILVDDLRYFKPEKAIPVEHRRLGRRTT
jgi:hypothetical protein